MQIRVRARPVSERSDERQRLHEPLTFGVPIPRGAVRDDTNWQWKTEDGKLAAVQARALDRWPDQSIRWLLVDVQADVTGAAVENFVLEIAPEAEPAPAADQTITVVEAAGVVTVDTNAATFCLRVGSAMPFEAVELGGASVLAPGGTRLTLIDAIGGLRHAEVRSITLEERGPLRTVVRLAGEIRAAGRSLDVLMRVHFFAGLPTVRLLTTITNPDRAKHTGGFWDLGDPGSALIKDVALSVPVSGSKAAAELYGSAELGLPWTKFDVPFELYQDSSGGEHWQCSNHLNREHRVPMTFRGYRIKTGTRAQSGLRATPIVGLSRGHAGAAVAVPHFWQNCPQAIEATEDTLTLRFLPGQYSDLHELQGGEQKTWESYLAFGPDGVTAVPLAWCRARSIAGAVLEWCLSSGAIPFLAPLAVEHTGLVNSAIEGAQSFERKREVIDEYGWRHFGEIYGDHEGVRTKSPTPLVSHYNNQYDPILGFANQFLRTGDVRWFSQMCELAAHVVDIDLYHTKRDKTAYNGGMFWHTFHYGDADTATHRTFPVAARGQVHGGGPSAGHNYTSGLVMHHFLTGDAATREAAIQLAQYVIDLDDGNQTVFRWLDRGATGHATQSADGYYGPGRGPANSLNALVDGYRLTGDGKYLAKAEELLRRVIHPADDISRRTLEVIEQRWFYTMFLQSLGKYLHDKGERGELDEAYAYGRASLLHYARWMADNEYPYLEKPERLEFPTETWPAQDIRKSDVLGYAAMHAAGDERARFLERARFFHESSIQALQRLATRTLARPVVVLLTSGFVLPWIDGQPGVPSEPAPLVVGDFGSPAEFVPQRVRAERRAKWLVAAAGAASAAALIWILLTR